MENHRVRVLKKNSFNVRTIVKEIIIKEKVEEQDPFYVCQIDDLVKKYRLWREKFPRVKPYYAVKCNDDQVALETLAAMGTGFDCASKNEIQKILDIGVSPDRIIYAKPTKQIYHIKYAKSVGVRTMTFDNSCELHKIKKIYPEARLVIRIHCKDDDSNCVLADKFGCDPLVEAPSLLKLAKSLGLDVIGVSFHIGWEHKPIIYQDAISAARKVFDMANIVGYDFKLLDIGGGFPGESYNPIDEVVQVINTALDDFFPDLSLEVMAEPGTFFVASAYTLACIIHSMKDTTRDDGCGISKKHKMYHINDGAYGSFNSWCLHKMNSYFRPEPLDVNLVSKQFSSSFWGPTCDGHDRILEDVDFPETNIGDWIIFQNFGAYTITACSRFNGLPIPRIFHVIEEENWNLLRDALSLKGNYSKC